MRTSRAPILSTILVSLVGCSEPAGPSVEGIVRDIQAVAGDCDGGHFGFNQGLPNPLSCCQDGNGSWHTNDGKMLAHRVHGDPCREADGTGTNCGLGSQPFVQCEYGPCSSRKVWVLQAASVHIFHPTSNPAKCGWDAEGIKSCQNFEGEECDWQVKGSRSFPEPFTDQAVYDGTTATCPFTQCLVGGIPAF
jgi:hypothetical protein